MSLEEIYIEEQLMVDLLLLKISPSLKGYVFIKEGVRQLIDDPNKKYNFHKRLYKDISQKYNESEEIVDRAVRHAIEVGYRRRGVEQFERATKFRFTYCKPSPRELLSMIAEHIRFSKEFVDPKVYFDSWETE